MVELDAGRLCNCPIRARSAVLNSHPPKATSAGSGLHLQVQSPTIEYSFIDTNKVAHLHFAQPIVFFFRGRPDQGVVASNLGPSGVSFPWVASVT